MKTTLKMNKTAKIKITSHMKMISKWRQPENDNDFIIKENLKKNILYIIMKTVPGPSLQDPNHFIHIHF